MGAKIEGQEGNVVVVSLGVVGKVSRSCFAAVVILVGGCYSSSEWSSDSDLDEGSDASSDVGPDVEPEGEPCPEPLSCLGDTAISVCADEMRFSRNGYEGCATIEIVGSGTECMESRSKVNLFVRAEGAAGLLMHATVVDITPGANFKGYLQYDYPCEDECYGGGGGMIDYVELGEEFESDTLPARTQYFAFLGEGVRYRVEFCPHR